MGALAYKSCSALCLLNAGTAYVISICFQRQIASLAIPCILNSWNSSEKARACFHASVLYLVLGVLLFLLGLWKSSVEEREDPDGAAFNGPYSASFLALPGRYEIRRSVEEELERNENPGVLQRLLSTPPYHARLAHSTRSDKVTSKTLTESSTAGSSPPRNLINYGGLSKRMKW